MKCLFFLLLTAQIDLGGTSPDALPEIPEQPPVPLSAPIPPERIMEEFYHHLRTQADLPAETIEFLEQRRRAAGPEQPAPTLDDCLAVISPAFKQALDRSAAEQNEQAADEFRRLTGEQDPYVSVSSAYFAAQALISLDQINEAREVLAGAFSGRENAAHFTSHAGEMLFLLGFTQANTMQYGPAERSLGYFLQHAPDAPERFRTSAAQMLTELQRRVPGRLPDVYDLMQYAHREMALGDTNDDVIRSQDEAIRLLDQMIQQSEQQEQQGKGKGGGGKSSGKNRKDSARRGARQADTPRDRTETNRDDDGRGIEKRLERARRARPGDAWGRLTPKEREQVLQSLQKQFPTQYRELVEQYYRQLSRDEAPR